MADLRLRSNVELHLPADAVLQGSTNRLDYGFPDATGPMPSGRYAAVIVAVGVTNVTVSGQGVIDGRGAWYDRVLERGSEPWPAKMRQGWGCFRAKDCRNLRLEGVTMRNPASWTCFLRRCEDVVIRSLVIRAHANWNNDGLDLEVRRARIENCDIDAEDDALVFKTVDAGWESGDVTVRDCTLSSNASALKFGTETKGAFRRYDVGSCRILSRTPEQISNGGRKRRENFGFTTTPAGSGSGAVVIAVVDGGQLEQVHIHDLEIGAAYRVPFFIRLGSRTAPPDNAETYLRGITLERVKMTAPAASRIACSVTGVPGLCVENVTLRDIQLILPGGGTAAEATAPVREAERIYPSAVWTFKSALPAHALFARHVRNLRVEGLRCDLLSPDARPERMLEDVTEAGQSLPECARLSFPISNHDQSDWHEVALPLVGVTNRVVDLHGQTLTVKPGQIGIVVKAAEGVTIRNVRIDAERPALTEARIVGFAGGETLVEIDERRYPMAIEAGRLVMVRGDRREPIFTAKLFDGRTHEMTARAGDTRYDGSARPVRTGVYALKFDFASVGAGGKVGDVIAFRPKWRRSPAMVVTGSKNVRFEDVIVHDAEGMALVAQTSENVAWCGTKTAAAKTSGVFPSAGRYSSTHADATHFANVTGEVRVENNWFEGMMDDAINVHSTCLKIEAVRGRTLRCRFMHEQAVGLELFAPGNAIRFIRAKSFENGPVGRVKAVKRRNARELDVTLTTAVPAGFGTGDAVEDATWQAKRTVFSHNVVRNNRARGAVFMTPGRVEVVSNLFDHVSGTGVLLAGDANRWYESGACEDVLLLGNRFRDCLATTTHGHSKGVITVDPNLPDPAGQQVKYHRNLRIVDNAFETFGTTLLFASSLDGLVWRGNSILCETNYPAWGKPFFVAEHSINLGEFPLVELSGVSGSVKSGRKWVRGYSWSNREKLGQLELDVPLSGTYMVSIGDLPPKNYFLAVDGFCSGLYTIEQLAAGVPVDLDSGSRRLTVSKEGGTVVTRSERRRWVALKHDVRSSLDGSLQPCYFWAPEKARAEPVPLVVGLHTWSANIYQLSHYRTVLAEAEKRGWAFVGPNFRGPNKTPSACGGEAAVRDIVDAVNFAKSRTRVDPNRVYIIGGSGGGHMTLLMLGRHPEIFAAGSAFCPITDLARWHADSLLEHPGRVRGYAKMLEQACGGLPSEKPDEYARRSPLTWLGRAKSAGVPTYVCTGIHDGWSGSVPVGHSLRAFNALCAADAVVSEADIAKIEADQAIPAGLKTDAEPDPFYKGSMRFRRTSGNVRLTLFEGGHGGNFAAGFDFLSRQRKGIPADWTLPAEASTRIERLSR